MECAKRNLITPGAHGLLITRVSSLRGRRKNGRGGGGNPPFPRPPYPLPLSTPATQASAFRISIPRSSLTFIRLLRVVFSSQQGVTEGVITTRSNRMKFRLPQEPIPLTLITCVLTIIYKMSASPQQQTNEWCQISQLWAPDLD